jgi:1-acyl-sn-glycerol-3-phosphate acyltransferase
MFFLLTLLLAIIGTSLYVYFEQYLKAGIVYWSIPLILLAFMLGIIIFTIIILYIITLFIRPDKQMVKPRRFNIYMTKIIAEFVTGFFGLKLVVKGLEKVPNDKQFLLVCNHQSNLDPIVTVWAFRKYQIAYIMKNAIMKVPLLGRWLYGCGFLPLDRKNDRKAMETIVIATKRIAENRHPIAVYPEGTRSKGPKMREFRNGVFKIAQKAQCPIVVLVIDNAYRVKWRFPFLRTKILIEVVDVLDYESFKDKHTNDLGTEIHQMMEDRLSIRRQELPWLKNKPSS